MRFLPKDEGARRAVLGIASVAFGMLMREVADRRQAAQRRPAPLPDPPVPAPQPTPPKQSAAHRQEEPPPAPEIIVRVGRPRLPEPKPPTANWLIRPITWRRWTIYLIMRLLLVAFTIIVLEVSSITAVLGYLYLALLPTIVVLLIPYGRPRQRRNPIEGPGALTVCVALIGVSAWPWYFYENATAPITPAPVLSSETFHLDPDTGASNGCITIIDDRQNRFFTGSSLFSSVRDNKITLYETAFGWTPDSHPTQSPTPFFNTPRLNQIGYSLTPDADDDNPPTICAVYNPSGYGVR